MDTTTITTPAPFIPKLATLALEVWEAKEREHTMVTITDGDEYSNQMVRLAFSFCRKDYRKEMNTLQTDTESNIAFAQRVFAGLALLEAMEAQGYTVPKNLAPIINRTK